MALHLYDLESGRLRHRLWHEGEAISPEMLWIDLCDPTREEEFAIESCLGMDVPTREEMHEIEISNRLYDKNGHVFMTASLLTHFDSDCPQLHAVTFIVSPSHLITVRYSDPQPFRTYPLRLTAQTHSELGGYALFVGLLETIINRSADILETIALHADHIATRVFRSQAAEADYQYALTAIGQTGDVTSKARESLSTLWRVALFAGKNLEKLPEELVGQLDAQGKDIAALSDHASFVSNKLSFLLDATLGMINIQQNKIIKIFSIAAVVFLPPTLIASIYGMNFHHMPELEWPMGYPMALGLMIVAAALPIWYFKRRKWL